MATVVAFHAHPDDEVLLAGGTLAQLAQQGHRVVVVLATDGGAGLAGAGLEAGGVLGEVRRAEAGAAATALGAAAVEVLGYPDSGMVGPVDPAAFSAIGVDGPAAALAAVLERERADVLIVDDENGGYGHRDHRQAHAVGRRAATLAGTARLLEATVDRSALHRAVRLAGWLPGLPDLSPVRRPGVYSEPGRITHCLDVTAQLAAKRAGFAAHASQHSGGEEVRTLQRFVALPGPVFRLVFRREWFVEHGAAGGRPWRGSLL